METSEKISELKKIALEINKFRGLAIARTATRAVPGEGNSDAVVMFIGEAPGYYEDQQGRPFVGLSGKLLEKSLFEIGLRREDVFITNIVKYRPPDNRDPENAEIEACKDWLDRQIAVIQPKIIATLGRFSMAKFLGIQSISKIHGQPRQVGEILIFPMYHPAAALRGTRVLGEFKEDFRKLAKILVEESLPPKEPKVEVVQATLF